MPGVLNVSEAASLGMHTMVFLASRPGETFTTRRIARRLNGSEAHLSKVMQRLTRGGLLESVRGPKGGFRLSSKNGDPTLLEVFETIEGPLVSTGCLLDTPACNGVECILGDIIESTDRRFREYLAGTRISELTQVYGGDVDGG